MSRWYGKIYLFFAFTLAGTSVISAKYVSEKLGYFTITAVSLLFAVLFLLPFCRKQLIHCFQRLTLHSFFLLLLQALFGIFLFRLLLLMGLQHTSASEAGILTGATPGITALLAILLLKESVTVIKIAGILSTASGILVIQQIFLPNHGLAMNHLFGNLLVLLAAASESTFNILSRVSAVKSAETQINNITPLVQTTIVSALAFLLCLVPAIFEHPLKSLSGIHSLDWLALLWYGLFVTALAFVCWYAGIQRCNAFMAAAFSGLMPFTSLILSTVILGEKTNAVQWLGGILIICGMVFIGSSGNEEVYSKNSR